jgi:hypothetical protein
MVLQKIIYQVFRIFSIGLTTFPHQQVVCLVLNRLQLLRRFLEFNRRAVQIEIILFLLVLHIQQPTLIGPAHPEALVMDLIDIILLHEIHKLPTNSINFLRGIIRDALLQELIPNQPSFLPIKLPLPPLQISQRLVLHLPFIPFINIHNILTYPRFRPINMLQGILIDEIFYLFQPAPFSQRLLLNQTLRIAIKYCSSVF